MTQAVARVADRADTRAAAPWGSIAAEDLPVRRTLAKWPNLRPEILYSLATDAAAEVRREVAGNAEAPPEVNLLLAYDEDEGVRRALARKIGRRIQEAAAGGGPEGVVLGLLGVLARDRSGAIRRIVAEAAKRFDGIPRAIVGRLARDPEIAVAAPVLEASPVLSERDLLEIIAGRPARGALAAIACRPALTVPVTDAVFAAALRPPGEPEAIVRLLANPSAQIREQTLDRILDHVLLG